MDDREHQQLQERLNRVEFSLSRLLDHLPGLAYRCSVHPQYQYRMIFVSRGCEKLLGLTQEEIANSPTNTVELMTLEEDLAGMRRALNQAVLNRCGYELYYRLRLGTDEIKWVWDQGDCVFDAEGNCVFLEGIMMDVTAQKNKERLLRERNQELQRNPGQDRGLGGLIGTSRAMRGIYDLIHKAAGSDTNVILYGETGVGKDLVAKTIHELSGLKGNFIPVNCGAIPDQLLESEFFGHVKGAFSGATTNRAGYLAAADKGTLFLDELGELPVNLQVKLLRALETRTYTPIGSTEPRRSHFRLVSATNQDLKSLIARKLMREDFFYRVHVLTIVVPPLRDRKDDIPLLAAAYAEARGLERQLSPELLRTLQHYDWPGNVRELQNTLERYWVFGLLDLDRLGHDDGGGHSDRGGLDEEEARQGRAAAPDRDMGRRFDTEKDRRAADLPHGAEHAGSAGDSGPVLAEARDDLEKRQILATLDKCAWKKARSAEALGITTRTLQRKLKKYGIGRRG